MASKARILVICTKSGLRSQLARDAFRRLAPEFEVVAASFQSDPVPPAALQVALERNIQLDSEPCPTIFEGPTRVGTYDHVISLCDTSGAENCMILRECVHSIFSATAHVEAWDVPFPGVAKMVHMTESERMGTIIDCIEGNVRGFLARARESAPV